MGDWPAEEKNGIARERSSIRRKASKVVMSGYVSAAIESNRINRLGSLLSMVFTSCSWEIDIGCISYWPELLLAHSALKLPLIAAAKTGLAVTII